MKKFGQKHADLMALLDQVPGVKEHMESFEVQMGEKILKRRIELGLTQNNLVEMVRGRGDEITQATVSKVERGDHTVNSETYEKILSALGGVKTLNIEFGELPKSSKRVLEFA